MPKGYRLEQFLDAFERYLPGDTPETKRYTLQTVGNCEKSASQNATSKPHVANRNPPKPAADKGCSVVAGQTPPEGGNDAYVPDSEEIEHDQQEREAIQDEPEIDLCEIPPMFDRRASSMAVEST